ncbi:hypothetical protein FOL47_004161 [Perkinsus chesapeaki]|uniref:Uncharacterized protein n=1 Tax=Perkinsus chesapeaki TaxID=330153 RepID=A0A7J6M409_PERCH|nr:hypothetical protein FOL47_004161 [Perkinsus chesapeaki]
MLLSFLLWLSIGGLYDLSLMAYALTSADPVLGQHEEGNLAGNLPVGRYEDKGSVIELEIAENNECKLTSAINNYELSFKTEIFLTLTDIQCYKGQPSERKSTPMAVRRLFGVSQARPFEASVIVICHSIDGKVRIRKSNGKGLEALQKIPETSSGIQAGGVPRFDQLLSWTSAAPSPPSIPRSLSSGREKSLNSAPSAVKNPYADGALSVSKTTAGNHGLPSPSRANADPKMGIMPPLSTVLGETELESRLRKAREIRRTLVLLKHLTSSLEKHHKSSKKQKIKSANTVEPIDTSGLVDGEDLLARAMREAGLNEEASLEYGESPTPPKHRRLWGGSEAKSMIDGAASPQPGEDPSRNDMTANSKGASGDSSNVKELDYTKPSNSRIDTKKDEDGEAEGRGDGRSEVGSPSNGLELPQLDETEIEDLLRALDEPGTSNDSTNHSTVSNAPGIQSPDDPESPQMTPYSFDDVLEGWETS